MSDKTFELGVLQGVREKLALNCNHLNLKKYINIYGTHIDFLGANDKLKE